MSRFSESVVEDAALDWLKRLGFTIKHSPHIAPGELAAVGAVGGVNNAAASPQWIWAAWRRTVKRSSRMASAVSWSGARRRKRSRSASAAP